jgi:heme-degrading monooxygenase HmoA
LIGNPWGAQDTAEHPSPHGGRDLADSVDEGLSRERIAKEDAMVIRVTWGKLRAGAWDEFERTYRANVIVKGKTIKGLRGRWLAQDSQDRDTGFAVSLWDNLADMQAYENSALYREIMAPLQPFFVGDYKTYRCEVRYTDVVA